MFQWYLELLTLKHETGPILIPSPPWFQDWRWGTQLFQEIQLRRQLPTLISYNAPDQRRWCSAGFGPFGGASRVRRMIWEHDVA